MSKKKSKGKAQVISNVNNNVKSNSSANAGSRNNAGTNSNSTANSNSRSDVSAKTNSTSNAKTCSSANVNSNSNAKTSSSAKTNSASTVQTQATAPYNFVSLPNKPLPAEVTNVASYKSHIADGETFSGEIQLDIETLTPMFIGGNDKDTSITFSPLGTPIIPGSSLRGMFKNIFKIVTCGTFRGRTTSQSKGEDFNDEHIYFRCIMKLNSFPWTAELNKIYSERMTSTKFEGRARKVTKKAIAGFLIKLKEGKYYIAPLKSGYGEGDISIRDKMFSGLDKSCVFWNGIEAYTFTGKDGKKKVVRYTEISDCDWNKRVWKQLPEDVRESYEHDRNRRGVDLLDDAVIEKRAELKKKNDANSRAELEKLDKVGVKSRAELEEIIKKYKLKIDLPPDLVSFVPCHYLLEGGKVTAFGHGQYFRIPYKRSIGDHVPLSLRKESKDFVDFSDAVFGCEKDWASRVFFDDAVTSNAATLSKTAAHPLMQPNPTSYQLYLKQSGEKLNHWDTANAQIRGYKMYWHNGHADWHATQAELDLDKGKSQDKRSTKDLTPLKPGTKFKSKIRFQNLSAVELGALMMIFDLNGAEDAAYKIGMGKPLGFGSIKIQPTLFVETADAYTKLFDDAGFKNPYEKKSPAEYLAAFKNYVDAQKMSETWEKIMEELNAILNWKNTEKADWSERIKPMQADVSNRNVDDRNKTADEKSDEKKDTVADGYKKRLPLPSILEVVK